MEIEELRFVYFKKKIIYFIIIILWVWVYIYRMERTGIGTQNMERGKGT